MTSLLGLLMVVVSLNYEIRPHVISWIYLSLLLLVWESYYKDGSRSIWSVPIIQILWANTQPTFVIGWAISACYTLVLAHRNKKIDRTATLVAGLSMVGCLANPYFLRGLEVPFTQFGFLQESNVFKTLIAEYSPLAFFPTYQDVTQLLQNGIFSPRLISQLLRLGLTALFAVQLMRRRLRFHDVLLFLFFFFIGMLAEKNIWYFLIGVTPIVTSNLYKEPQKQNHHARQVALIVMAILPLLMSLRIATNDYYAAQRLSHKFGYKYNNLLLPVQAANFLTHHALRGKVLNHINFGGFFIDHIPQKVFIDGRNEIIGEDLAVEYMQTFSAQGVQKLIAQYDIQIVAFPHKDGTSWFEYLRNDSSRWRLAYFDELAAVYLRNDYETKIPRVKPDSVLSSMQPLGVMEMDTILAKSFHRGLFDPFLFPQYFPVKESELSAFCSDNGWPKLAIRWAIEGIRLSSVECPELYFNLSLYFREAGDIKRADFCRRKYEALLRS